MNDKVKELWEGMQKKLPNFNCILYPDGTITVLDFYRFYDSNENIYYFTISALCDTTLDSVLKYDDDPWVLVDEWCVISNDMGIFLSGDGAMGNDGFVAHTDCDGKLKWAMFFNQTNPIKDLEINNNYLIGISEHNDAKIEINLKQLTDIKFTYIKTKQSDNCSQSK